MKNSLNDWDEVKVLKEALKYKSRSEFCKQSSYAYKLARIWKILDKVCKHMPKKEVKPDGYWTLENIKKAALQYPNRFEFKQKESTAYHKARKLKILDDICSHMICARVNPPKPQFIHSFESCLKKAEQCETKMEFYTKYPNEAAFLSRNGLYQKLMKKRKFKSVDGASSVGEISCRKFINKLLGIKLKKIKKVKWLVSSKGYCLELDGYDGKNKIAFEYSGDFYHKKYNRIKVNDALKTKICKERNITFIKIKEIKNKPFYKNIDYYENLILKIVKKLGLIIEKPKSKLKLIFNGEYYTEKQIIQTIKKCTSYREFYKKYGGMYQYLKARSLMHYTDSLPRIKKEPDRSIITYKSLREKMNQSDSYREFRFDYNRYLKWAQKNGYFDEIKSYYKDKSS